MKQTKILISFLSFGLFFIGSFLAFVSPVLAITNTCAVSNEDDLMKNALYCDPTQNKFWCGNNATNCVDLSVITAIPNCAANPTGGSYAFSCNTCACELTCNTDYTRCGGSCILTVQPSGNCTSYNTCSSSCMACASGYVVSNGTCVSSTGYWSATTTGIYNTNSNDINLMLGATSNLLINGTNNSFKFTSGGYMYSSTTDYWLNFSNLSSDSLKVTGNLHSTEGTLKIDGTGNSYIMGKLGIGMSSTPSGAIDVASAATTNGYWLGGKAALTGESATDNWLRLNQNSSWTNGVYTPLVLRVDGELRQGATDAGAYGIQTSGMFYSAGATHLAVTGGNVGVGTTNPLARLDINGNFKVTGATSTIVLDKLSGTGNRVVMTDASGSLFASTGSNVPAASLLGQTLYSNGSNWIASTSPLYNNGTNVGIGMTVPGEKLVVSGDARVYSNFYIGGPSDTQRFLHLRYNSTSWPDYASYITQTGASDTAGTRGLIINENIGQSASNYGINFSIAGSSKLFVQYSGNVGIGTVNPTSILTLGSSTPVITVDTSAGSDNKFLGLSGSGAFDSLRGGAMALYGLNYAARPGSMYFWTGGSGSFVFNTGNVGIGATTTNDKLHVVGNATISGIASCSGTGSAIKTDTSGRLVCGTVAGGITGLGVNNYITKWTGTSTIATSTIYDNGTSVGIGTVAPFTTLSVSQNGTNFPFAADAYGGAGSAVPGMLTRGARGTQALPTATLVNDYIGVWGGRGYGTTIFSSASRALIAMRAAETFTDSAQGTYLTFSTTPIGTTTTYLERMRILDNGYVGIGVTNPSKRLDLGGGINGRIFGIDTTTAAIFTDGEVVPKKWIVDNFAPKVGGASLWATSTAGTYNIDLGNVGIGATNPNGKLSVNGAVGIGLIASTSPVDNMLDIASDKGSGSGGAIRARYISGGGLLNTEFGALTFKNSQWVAAYAMQGSASAALYTDGEVNMMNGNVGIGTTNPSKRLDLGGGVNGRIFGIDTTTAAIFTDSEVVPKKWIVDNFAPKVGGASLWATSTTGTYNIDLGNVGIGTNNPQSKLEVSGKVQSTGFNNARTVQTVKGLTWSRIVDLQPITTTGSSFIVNISGTRNSVVWNSTWQVTTGHSTYGYLTLLSSTSYTQSRLRLVVDSNGDGYLEFYDQGYLATLGTDQTIYVTVNNLLGTSSVIGSFQDGTSAAGYTVMPEVTSISGGLISQGGALISGNVGIGTTNPSKRLDLGGGINGRIFGIDTTTAAIFTDGEVVPKKWIVDNFAPKVGGASLWATSTAGTYNIDLGSVGIGTTIPGQKLEIAGTSVSGVGSQSNISAFVNNGMRISASAANSQDAITYQSGVAGGGTAISFGRGSGWDTFMGFYTNSNSNAGTGSIQERMRIDSVGNVGIGTTAPGQKLEVNGDFKANHLEQGTLVVRPYVTWSGNGATTGAVIIKLPGATGNYGMLHMEINTYEYGSNSATTYICGGHNWNSAWYNYSCNTLGVSDKKIRLAFKDGQYAIVIGEAGSSWSYGHVVLSKITTGGYYSGIMDLGGAYTIAQDNSAEAYPWISPDLNRFNARSGYFAGNVGIGTTTAPTAKLNVYTTSGIAIDSGNYPIKMNYVPTSLEPSVLVNRGLLDASISASGASFWASTTAGVYNVGLGSVGIGTSTPATRLHVYGGGITVTNGDVIITNSAGTSKLTVDKITVGTIDPLYEIRGIKYSTFAPSIVGGVKEEVTGKIKISKKVNDEYQAVIDFNQETVGSDLWVWHNVIAFSKDNVEAIITPYGNFASVYYYISGNQLIFKSDKPVEISYRLLAKRFDWQKWPTLANDQSEKAGLIIK